MNGLSALSRRSLLALLAGVASIPLAARTKACSRVYVRSVGDGEKTWVLLHPFTASGRFWDARAAALAAEHKVRIIAPDLPSHGRSSITERFDYNQATTAIEDAIGTDRSTTAIFVGASSGSIVAMKLAARWKKPVVAIGSGFAFSGENVETMRQQSAKLQKASAQFAEAFLEQGIVQLAALQRHFGDLADLGESPLLTEAEAAALVHRVLIINGAKDTFFSRESAHALADAIPGSVLSFVTGADHLEPLAATHRDFTWAQVEAFVRIHAAE